MVNGRRVALVTGVMVVLYALVLIVDWQVPDRFVGMLGGATGLDRSGGKTVHLSSRRDHAAFTVDLAGDLESTTAQLEFVVAGSPEFHAVKSGEVFARAFPELARDSIRRDAEVGWRMETWRTDAGMTNRAIALVGWSRASLEHAIDTATADGTLARDTSVGYEQQASLDGRREPEWRALELDPRVELDGSMVADATPSVDPNTQRPIVLVDFDRSGGDRLYDVTKRLVGHKLAVTLGSRVLMAPVINEPIRGGRVSINMGAGDSEHHQADTQAFARQLRVGPYPPSVVESEEWHDPHDTRMQERAARIIVAVLAGLVAAVLAFSIVKLVRPSWRVRPDRVDGPFPWRRLVVTLIAPVALWLLADVDLPFINDVELSHVVRSGGNHVDVTRMSLLMLGVSPILTAFGLVEVVALVVPPLRWRRHDPAGRIALGQAAAAVSIAFALLQAWFISGYFESLSRGGAEVVAVPGYAFRIQFTLGLAAATMLIGVLAGMVREHGLGNGYGVVLVSTAFVGLAPRSFEDVMWWNGQYVAFVALVVIAVATSCVLRWRIAEPGRPSLRVPSSGLEALSPLGGFGYVVALVTAFGMDFVLVDVIDMFFELERSRAVIYASIVVAVPVWSWLFSRPRVVADVAVRAKLSPPSGQMWLRGTIASLALLAFCFAAGRVAHVAAPESLQIFVTVAGAMIATATILDIIDDARAWRRTLQPAAVIHQIQFAGVVEHVLAGENIPCHIHASNLRTLLAFFGPWAPAIVLVPEAHAETARARLGDVLPARWIRSRSA